MSDYVDTVNIEGVEYDIQDTATKQALADFEEGFVVSSEKVDTGQKWSGNKTIFRQLLTVSLTNFTDMNLRRLFEVSLPNNVSKLISVKGFYRCYGQTDNLVFGQTVQGVSFDENMVGFISCNLWIDTVDKQHFGIVTRANQNYKRITGEFLIEYIE